jgi:hypothetical protein
MSNTNKYDGIRKRDASPYASSLVESLRDLGYTPETAVADIIDNAIFAQAQNIWIDFDWDKSNSRVTICDDGRGMTEEELAQAMRPGSTNPKDERSSDDLGRFGLGLKTASFSQCRVFTVVSKTTSEPLSCWRWDLDYIMNHDGGWNILNTADKKDIERVNNLKNGTLVVWEELDRIIENGDSVVDQKDNFLDVADKIKRHLELIFHRFIETGKLNIYFNSHKLIAWDPFLRGETTTQPLPEELLSDGQVKVKPYILPHRSKIDPEVWMDSEKRGGWDNLQGFYIYRNERLLLAADWLGLKRKQSHYKLARIMINLPNHLDNDWQIDIKKSRARPPAYLRQDLKAIINTTVIQAEEVFRHRGKAVQRSLTSDFSFVWKEMVRDGRYYFTINREHPVIATQLEKLSGKKTEINRLLRLIEETVPGPSIISKENEYPDSMLKPFELKPPDEIIAIMKELFNGWMKQGMNEKEARQKILMTEPFSDYPQYIENLSHG